MVAELDVIAPICNSQFGICQRTGTDRLTDDMLTPDYIHWLNTAFTRATEKLYLVNWPKTQVEE